MISPLHLVGFLVRCPLYMHAGETASFSIETCNAMGIRYDEGGDPYFVQIRFAGLGLRVRSKLIDNTDGSYLVTYKPTAAGKCSIHVSLYGEHLPGSPFTCYVSAPFPFASQCVATGEALSHVVACSPHSFQVKFCNAAGELAHACELDMWVHRANEDDASGHLERGRDDEVQWRTAPAFTYIATLAFASNPDSCLSFVHPHLYRYARCSSRLVHLSVSWSAQTRLTCTPALRCRATGSDECRCSHIAASAHAQATESDPYGSATAAQACVHPSLLAFPSHSHSQPGRALKILRVEAVSESLVRACIMLEIEDREHSLSPTWREHWHSAQVRSSKR